MNYQPAGTKHLILIFEQSKYNIFRYAVRFIVTRYIYLKHMFFCVFSVPEDHLIISNNILDCLSIIINM